MGHMYTDLVVRGSKGEVELKQIMIDTGATYTVLPEDVLDKVGAWGPITSELEVRLGDGKKIKGKAYSILVKIQEVEAPTISLTFEGAESVVGVETLESIGVKLDLATGKLEFTRPPGVAYFY